eukprot:260134-Heterocapsa_arctica.AAC.1
MDFLEAVTKTERGQRERDVLKSTGDENDDNGPHHGGIRVGEYMRTSTPSRTSRSTRIMYADHQR